MQKKIGESKCQKDVRGAMVLEELSVQPAKVLDVSIHSRSWDLVVQIAPSARALERLDVQSVAGEAK